MPQNMKKKGYCNKTTYIPQQSISTKIVRKKNYYGKKSNSQITNQEKCCHDTNQTSKAVQHEISFSSIQYIIYLLYNNEKTLHTLFK